MTPARTGPPATPNVRPRIREQVSPKTATDSKGPGLFSRRATEQGTPDPPGVPDLGRTFESATTSPDPAATEALP